MFKNIGFFLTDSSIGGSFVTKNARKRKSARGVAGLIQLDKIKIMFNILFKIISDNNQ